jgi:hypothetical protein
MKEDLKKMFMDEDNDYYQIMGGGRKYEEVLGGSHYKSINA